MRTNFYGSIRKKLMQTSLIKKIKEIILIKSLPKYFSAKKVKNKKKSIIFLCLSENKPVGGAKVIYNQVAVINSMTDQLTASVLHPFNKEFSCTWFDHNAIIKKNLEIDRYNDFVMIPEIWAIPHARLLRNIGVRYGIYVQNGYLLSLNNSEELDTAYKKSDLILAISDDTVELIKIAYPECSDRVYRTHYSVNSNKFIIGENKENIICYMPRKLKKHTELVTFFLKKNIPKNWKIQSIYGMDENGVAAILRKSRIFLSFSEFEGCPLPPVEAGLSGCQVIGYTGEGAKEYWDKEIFTEIYSGDIRSFVNAVLNKINEIDSSTFIQPSSAIKKLANKYSSKSELKDMIFLSKKVIDIINSI